MTVTLLSERFGVDRVYRGPTKDSLSVAWTDHTGQDTIEPKSTLVVDCPDAVERAGSDVSNMD